MKTGTVTYLVKDGGKGYKPHTYFVAISTSEEIEHFSGYSIVSAISINEDTTLLIPPHKLIKSNSEDEIIKNLLEKLHDLDDEHNTDNEYISSR